MFFIFCGILLEALTLKTEVNNHKTREIALDNPVIDRS